MGERSCRDHRQRPHCRWADFAGFGQSIFSGCPTILFRDPVRHLHHNFGMAWCLPLCPLMPPVCSLGKFQRTVFFLVVTGGVNSLELSQSIHCLFQSCLRLHIIVIGFGWLFWRPQGCAPRRQVDTAAAGLASSFCPPCTSGDLGSQIHSYIS